jgi:3-oxocholest-4-en-26-oyl-CoA dehydrogenase beta subunit
MNFDLNEEQTMLKDTARKFLSEACNGEFLRAMKHDESGYNDALWKKMVDLGWTCILIPEEYGGLDGSLLDMAVLLYEMGYSCLPGPFFPTAVSGVISLLEAGSDEQKKRILPGIAAGERKMALAWLEEEGINTSDGIHLKAERLGDQYILNGIKLFVKDAHIADSLVCAARTKESVGHGGISLFIVGANANGLGIYPLRPYTGEKLNEVLFEGVRIPSHDLLGKENEGWTAFRKIFLKCAVLKSAEMCGGAEKVLQFATDYAKERVQFGRPIGAFQAIQHHCSNMLMEYEGSKYLTYLAAWKISEGMENFEQTAMMCKSSVSDSYRRLLKLCAQVLGGTGFCEEHDFHLYCQRGKAAELDFGNADFHREWFAEEMGL